MTLFTYTDMISRKARHLRRAARGGRTIVFASGSVSGQEPTPIAAISGHSGSPTAACFRCAISMLGAVGGNPARGRLRQPSRRALVGMTEARGVEPRQGLRLSLIHISE